MKGAELVVIKDGPHNVAWTHAEEVNRELVRFLGQKAGAKGGLKGVKEPAVA